MIFKTVPTFEVTFPATRPDIVKILVVNQVLHPPRLGLTEGLVYRALVWSVSTQ